MTGSGRQTPSSLAELTTLIAASPGFAEVLTALHSGRSAAIDGAWGSSCALSIAAIAAADPKRTHLIILPTIRDAEEFVDELTDLPNSGVMLFPAWESLPEIIDAGDSVYAARVSAVRRLSQTDRIPTAIVTCLPALLQPVPTRASIQAATRTISVGDDLPLAELTDWLILRGFERVTAVELPGEFSIHGGILDIFPASEPDAIRIELFGDEVESIRSFDVESQRRLEDLKSISLTATLAATPLASNSATPQTSPGASDVQSTGKGKSKRTKSETKPADAPTAPAAAPLFSGETESLIDSLSRQTIVILTDMQQAISEGRMYLQRLSNPVGLYGVDATMARLMEFSSVTIDALGVDGYEQSCHLPIEAVERFSGSRRDALVELSELLGPSDSVLLCCHNEGEQGRLQELIAETDSSSGTSLASRICLTTGRIRRGFRLLDHALIVISDNELFSRTPTRATTRKRRTDSRTIDTFLDLREGDLVVHVAHGIARYRGMAMTGANGQQEEHLLLEFRDALIVYVPVSLIHLVQKYIGPAKTTPELTKYGGTSWLKKKDQVAEAISDMATDMLQLQAERASKAGIQCRADSHLQQEFEKAFPYTETPDQASAISDLKGDMEQSKPMDRLICGDVGFGKTEVAMRAVFKAVDNGRQVAVLVPTTVLAEQHFRTFSQRMAEFPVTVEMLSRYRSAAEQSRILERLKEGGIDIVIGTHRLVSKDVKFRDLGLLVVDEEQKFGVKVKERLKHTACRRRCADSDRDSDSANAAYVAAGDSRYQQSDNAATRSRSD